jgi:CRISPR-associated protein Cmr3
MGEETWAESSLIPNPSVLWGALFTTMLHEGILTKDLLDELEIKDLLDELVIKDIFLYQKSPVKKLIPAPLDIYFEKGKKHLISEDYQDIMESGVISSLPEQLKSLVLPDTKTKNAESRDFCFIDWDSFTNNYPKQDNKSNISQSTDIALKSPKIGIGRSNDTLTAQDSQLYRIDMSEFKKEWKIAVVFEAPIGFPESGVLRLGGEGKTAKFNSITTDWANIDSPSTVTDALIKVYFQTPAFFDSGNGIEEISRIPDIHLLSASIGKPMPIGGYDMAQKMPKPMRKAVPPGSVYVIKGDINKVRSEISKFFHKDDLSRGYCIFHCLQF